MKRLNRILLVNWYLIDYKEVRIEGHTAFIGPNASGKSSLLDAIQTVLVGGHGHFLNLNPSAGEKSTRSLRDYCLGVVRDPNNPEALSRDLQPRQQALTYLVLSFIDERSGEETAVGVAMHASLDQPTHQIDGRFVAPNLSVVLQDLLIPRGDDYIPKPWAQVREEFRRRCPGFRVIPHPEHYVRELGVVLSADGTEHIDYQRFLKNFQNAITFAPIRNVSEFVRRFILDHRPIKVHELQRSLQNYREISEKTQEVKSRLNDLKAIDALYQKAARSEQLAQQYAWIAQEAEVQALEAEREPIEESLQRLRDREQALLGEIEALDTSQGETREQLTQLEVQLQSSDLVRERERLQAQRETVAERLRAARERFDQARQGLEACRQLIGHAELLPEPLVAAATAVAEQLPQEALLHTLWPEQPESFSAQLQPLGASLSAATADLEQRHEALAGEERQLGQELQGLRQRIERLERGEADLEASTLALQALLAAEGIRSVPLCDLLDVRDEAWRESIESYLGGHREALVVDPSDARRAVALYRHEGRRHGLHGCRIVNTLKSEEWSREAAKESLAAMIESDDPHARAYANRLLGTVRRVESEEELLHHERAVTADGMLHANGAVSRLAPTHHKLGRAAREQRLMRLKQQFAEQAAELAARQREKNALKELLREAVHPLAQTLARMPDLVAESARRQRLEAEFEALEAQGATLADSDEYQRLAERIETLRAKLKTGQETLNAGREEKEGCGREAARLEVRAEELERHLAEAAEERRQLAREPGFDSEEATKRLEELEAKHLADGAEAAGYREIAETAAVRAQDNRSRVQEQREQAYGRVVEHRARHGQPEHETAALGTDHHQLAAWVMQTLRELEESALADYAEQAGKALQEAEHAFRADFVGRLHENLAMLDDKLKEINRFLRNRPFHGEYYSFVKRPNPEFEAIIEWVESWTPEEGSQVGGLFDSFSQGEHPHAEAIRQVRELLMEGSGGDAGHGALADYRNYYHFDVRMTEEGDRNATFLSRRIGKGSGGEHQAPFYVAIGAALAATYRLVKQADGSIKGGMALAVFDEAFSKLDVHNTVNALQFLNDLGLQVLLAAPDEKYGLMSEQMDTIVNVYRAGGAVDIDVEYVKPAARALLSADNPVKRRIETTA